MLVSFPAAPVGLPDDRSIFPRQTRHNVYCIVLRSTNCPMFGLTSPSKLDLGYSPRAFRELYLIK